MLTKFEKLPLLAILRGITEDHIEPIADICKNTGLTAIEITMNTKNAATLITLMKQKANSAFSVGAGTVVNTKDLDIAIKAGAEFIVMPIIEPKVIRACVSQNIPVFPGAFTPSEIYKAWELGATMVKVFPSSIVGPKYFKEIKGPFNLIKLLACGGISETTIKDFFTNGADAAAFGASIFKQEWLEKKEFNRIEDEIKKLITSYNS